MARTSRAGIARPAAMIGDPGGSSRSAHYRGGLIHAGRSAPTPLATAHRARRLIRVQPPVAARRLAYRSAYRVLTVSWLIRRPAKSGVKCLLVNQERILLVRHTYGYRGWDLPGGAIKRHEAPLTAARREMHEELGVEADGWISLGTV